MNQCELPPELDDIKLAAFVAGEADRTTTDHLANCTYCRARAAALARLHQNFAQPFFRAQCPSPDDLREYYFGFMPSSQIDEISLHLQSCARCTRELVLLEGFMADAPASSVAISAVLSDIGQRVKTILAQLLPRSTPGAPTPALSGLRGVASDQLLYQAGELQISLQSERDPQQPDGRVLLGALWGGDTEGWIAHLWQDQQLIAATPVDDLGSFRFDHLTPATYAIILADFEQKIQISPVEVA